MTIKSDIVACIITKTQTSLLKDTVWSAPLLFALQKSIIIKLAKYKNSIFLIASNTKQAVETTLARLLKTDFLARVAFEVHVF